MLVVAWCALALASPLLAGRWPAGLITYRWRWPALVWAVLVFQAFVLEIKLPQGVAPVLHVLTYVAAVAFLWLNRRVTGVWFVAAGAASNGLVIALNGGTLPARSAAVEAAGIDHDLAFANSAVVDNPVLPWLGDYFAWPEPLPLANTFSVGDVLIVAGVFVAAWSGAKRLGKRDPADARDTDAETGASGHGDVPPDAGKAGAPTHLHLRGDLPPDALDDSPYRPPAGGDEPQSSKLA